MIAARNAVSTLGGQFEARAVQPASFRSEVIISDNRSTDATMKVALAMAERLPDLRRIAASARRGAGAARNVGASAARGGYLAFCDSDDVVGAGWASTMHTALAGHAFAAGRLDGTLLNGGTSRASRVLPQKDGLQMSPHSALPRAACNMGVRA